MDNFSFFNSLKIVLINMITILMISAKMATLGFLKITVFWNKGYDVVMSVYDVTNKIYHVTQIILQMWSCLVTLAFLWEKLSQPQFCKGLTRNPPPPFFFFFFWGGVLVQVQWFGTDTSMALKFYSSVVKGSPLPSWIGLK